MSFFSMGNMGEKNKVDATDILVKRTNDMFQVFLFCSLDKK